MKHSSMTRFWWTVSLTATLALTAMSCKENDFLYYQNPPEAKVDKTQHKLKQLVGNSVVDILWVIDNSGSMGDYQDNVIQSTQAFMDQFTQKSGLKWKMGLISTDDSNQPFVGMSAGDLLDYQTPDPISKFQSAVGRLGTSGSPTEEGFNPLLKALRGHPNFLRQGSILAVIFVTDAYEQGDMAVKGFMQDLAAIHPLADVVSYGIFGAADLGCYNPYGGEESWDYAGSRYEEFIKTTRGKTYKLCVPDFGTSLSDMGQDLVSRVNSPRLFLNSRPVVATLRVSYKGMEVKGGPKGSDGFWTYDYQINAIVFHDLSFAPGDDEEVEVSFEEERP